MATAEERDLARRAWDRTVSSIEGVAEVFKPLREPFVKAITEGQSPDEIETELIDRLAEREWTWPWFDEWLKVFTEWGAFPAGWPPLAPEPDADEPYTEAELAEYRQAAIASLIPQTIALVFFRDRRLAHAHGFERWTLATTEDPVEQRVAKDKHMAIVSGNYDSLPPFFPGDRTTMQAVPIPGPADDARPDKQDAGADAAADEAAAGGAVAAVAAEAMLQSAVEAAEPEGTGAADETGGEAEDGGGKSA